MTALQWEALLEASHGRAERFHGKTKNSLAALGLAVFVPGRGICPTVRGLNRLYERYPAGAVGKEEAADGRS